MPRRAGVLPLVVGIITMALVATGSIQSNASPAPSQSSTAASQAAKPVLTSEYGKATSRAEGQNLRAAAAGDCDILNLVLALAGLLDANGVFTQISQILNSILAILRL